MRGAWGSSRRHGLELRQARLTVAVVFGIGSGGGRAVSAGTPAGRRSCCQASNSWSRLAFWVSVNLAWTGASHGSGRRTRGRDRAAPTGCSTINGPGGGPAQADAARARPAQASLRRIEENCRMVRHRCSGPPARELRRLDGLKLYTRQMPMASMAGVHARTLDVHCDALKCPCGQHTLLHSSGMPGVASHKWWDRVVA